MKITCPKCEFKGLIDTEPLAFNSRVTCVRCGTTFEAELVEGEILTGLLPEPDESPLMDVPAPVVAASVEEAAEVEDVLLLPQAPAASPATEEPSLREAPTEDDVDVSPAVKENVLEVESEEPAPAIALVPAEVAPPANPVGLISQELAAQPLAMPEAHEAVAVRDDKESGLAFKQAEAVSPALYDTHGAGMRLMRISPLWLVLCGVSFIAVIILSNHFGKTAAQQPQVAATLHATDNRAVNQSSSAPTTTADKNSSESAPEASRAETKKDAAAPEEKSADKGSVERKEAAPEIIGPTGTKDEAKDEASAPARRDESEMTGGFAVQVGSFNVIEQANERVARLRSAGFDARMVMVELPGRGKWYRVQSGRFRSRDEAASYGGKLKSNGATDDFIVTEAGK